MPPFANHAVEIEPCRAAQMRGVALQMVAAQVAAEQLLAESDRLRGVISIESVRLPGLLAGLNDHGRQILAELIGVNLKPAVRGVFERECEGREGLRGSKPDEAALAPVDVRQKCFRVPVADAAVAAIRGDDQIRVREGAFVFDLMPESLVHAEFAGTLL